MLPYSFTSMRKCCQECFVGKTYCSYGKGHYLNISLKKSLPFSVVISLCTITTKQAPRGHPQEAALEWQRAAVLHLPVLQLQVVRLPCLCWRLSSSSKTPFQGCHRRWPENRICLLGSMVWYRRWCKNVSRIIGFCNLHFFCPREHSDILSPNEQPSKLRQFISCLCQQQSR